LEGNDSPKEYLVTVVSIERDDGMFKNVFLDDLVNRIKEKIRLAKAIVTDGSSVKADG
jgi:hypothetical protein